MINTNNTARISKDEELKREINNLNVKVGNENEKTSIRILDIDLKINTQNTKLTELRNDLDKFIPVIEEKIQSKNLMINIIILKIYYSIKMINLN